MRNEQGRDHTDVRRGSGLREDFLGHHHGCGLASGGEGGGDLGFEPDFDAVPQDAHGAGVW